MSAKASCRPALPTLKRHCDITIPIERFSYVYGRTRLILEQINTTTGIVLYLHHDQQRSIRLVTSSTGTEEASYTYDAYGNTTGTTGTAKTPLGFDAQYTSTDTGLIYLRARTYDPATAQFLSVDPLAGLTRAPYTYTEDNPVNAGDPSGLLCFDPTGLTCKLEHELASGFEHAINKLTFGLVGSSSPAPCTTVFKIGEGLGMVGGLFVPGEGEAEGLSISAKIARQMETRGWSEEEIQEAIRSGEQIPAVNKATGRSCHSVHQSEDRAVCCRRRRD